MLASQGASSLCEARHRAICQRARHSPERPRFPNIKALDAGNQSASNTRPLAGQHRPTAHPPGQGEYVMSCRQPREPLRRLPRVMIPFEAVRRCIDALRFPTLLVGPELEKWLSQHVERLPGIPCPSRLQRAQLAAARWLTEAPEPEIEATEDDADMASAGQDGGLSLSDLPRETPEPDEASARAAAERLRRRRPTPASECRQARGVHDDHKSRGVR